MWLDQRFWDRKVSMIDQVGSWERGRRVTYKGEAVAIETEVGCYGYKICTKHLTGHSIQKCAAKPELWYASLHKMPAGTAASEQHRSKRAAMKVAIQKALKVRDSQDLWKSHYDTNAPSARHGKLNWMFALWFSVLFLSCPSYSQLYSFPQNGNVALSAMSCNFL